MRGGQQQQHESSVGYSPNAVSTRTLRDSSSRATAGTATDTTSASARSSPVRLHLQLTVRMLKHALSAH
jgi:hypothetical protein